MSRLMYRLAGSLLALFLSISAFGASPALGAYNGGGSGGGSGGAAAWMYDPSVVVDINLQIADITQVSCNMRDPRPFVPATFTLTYTKTARGRSTITRYGPWVIGVHAKGYYGSFRCLQDDKAGLKLKFSNSSQRIDGIKKLTLNNMVQDGSMSREAISYEAFRSMGIAAPRTGYARVVVNGEPKGLYLNLETYDDVMLARWFPTTQHLYEGSYGLITWDGWCCTNDAYSPHYEVDEGDDVDRSDLQNLLSTAQNFSDGWYARMAPIANLEQMTRMWALEAYLGHWDGYSQFITNNYFIHFDGYGIATMHPWGMDNSLQGAPRYDFSGEHFIFNGCVADPICASMYTDALRAVNTKIKSLRLNERAEKIAMVVGTYCGCDASGNVSFLETMATDYDSYETSFPAKPRTITVTSSRGATKVSWSPPSSIAGITGYAIEYRSTQNRNTLGAWTRVLASALSRSATLTALPASTYEFRVRSVIDREHTSLPITKSNIRIR